MRTETASDIKEIKTLAKRFTPEQIEGCLTTQLKTGKNICLRNSSAARIINELAKASFVRQQMEKGMSLADSLRDLAMRMRRIQQKELNK